MATNSALPQRSRSLEQLSAHSSHLRELRVKIVAQRCLHPRTRAPAHYRIPYFLRITRTLSSGIASTVRPRLVTVLAMNIEL